MKKYCAIFISCLLLVLSLSVFSGCTSSKTRQNTLRVYNWEDYIDKDVIKDFEVYYKEKTKNPEFKVIYETFDTNETMLTKIEKGKEDYDVVCPSEYAIEKMFNKGLLLPINTTTMNNYKYVSPYVQEKFVEVTSKNDKEIYGVGYCWGTLGIMYNVKNHGAKMGWDMLFDEANKGKILMKDSVRDALAGAAIYSNKDSLAKLDRTSKEYSKAVSALINPTSKDALPIIETTLKNQKKDLNAYYEVDDGKNDMTLGTYNCNLAWSGDAWWAIQEALKNNVELDYNIPAEGSNVWFDGWCMPKYAKNIEAGQEFINFLCNGENAVRNMDACGYSTVVANKTTLTYYMEQAEEIKGKFKTDINASYFFAKPENDNDPEFDYGENYTDESFIVPLNRINFPTDLEANVCAVMHDFGDLTPAVVSMWTAVKGDAMPVWAIVLFVLGIVLVVGVIVFFVLKNNKKNKKSKRKVNKSKIKK